MKGYLIDEVDCPVVVRAFLAHWMNLHNIMWAVQDHNCHAIQDKHYDLLCPPNSNSFRLYVNMPTDTRNPYEIVEFNGSRSRFTKKMSTKCNSSKTARDFQGVLSAAGEIVEDRKAEMETDIENIKQKMAPLEKIFNEKKKQSNRVKDDIAEIRGKKAEYQKIFTLETSTKNTIASEKKKKKEITQKLAKNMTDEKKEKIALYEDSIVYMLKCIKETLKAAEEKTKLQVQGAATTISCADMSSKLREIAETLAEMKEGLEQYNRAVRDAQRDRWVEGEIFVWLPCVLYCGVECCGVVCSVQCGVMLCGEWWCGVM